MNVTVRPLLLLALLSAALAACSPQDQSLPGEAEEEAQELSSGSCGVERWAVKTGSDSQVGLVNLTPASTTIAALRAIPVPSGFGSSSPREVYSGSPELQVYKLTNVKLTQFKMEADSDYHLVLQDSSGNTMIAEIAYPGCLSGSSWTSQITASRNAFDAKYTATTSFQTVNDTVTVVGVGFFDVLHGQTGVAPNGIELHSVFSICWGTNCSGGASPDFTLAASPASVSGAGSATVTVGALNGFSSAVSLSVSGAPSGATASLSPASVTGSGSSTLTLTPGSAAAGTYALTVTGTSGSLSHTATLSWTISSGGGGGSAIVNGGFESGLTGWTTTGIAAATRYPHSGSYACTLGNSSPSTDNTAAQTFTVPATASTLSFWYRIICPDTITYDWATATLTDNTAGTTVTMLPNTCTNTNTWVQASTSVTAMRGHSVTLTLVDHDDNYAGDATYTDFDDVTLQ
jgi:hypothetical protein